MTGTTADLALQAAALADMAAAGHDISEAALTIGQAARTQGDAFRFILGAVGGAMQTAYGEATMAKWARDVKIGSLSTARQYVRIVRALGLTSCIQYLAKDISFTLMRKVVFSLKDDSAAQAYLDAFANAEIGSEPAPLPKSPKQRAAVYLDIQDARICDVNYQAGTVTLFIGAGVDDLTNLPRPGLYHLIVKDLTEPAEQNKGETK